MTEEKPNTPPPETEAEQEARAIKFIIKVTKAAANQDLTEPQARELYLKAKERILSSMAQAQG